MVTTLNQISNEQDEETIIENEVLMNYAQRNEDHKEESNHIRSEVFLNEYNFETKDDSYVNFNQFQSPTM